jgi:N-acetylglucosamine malate deacetylase 1
VERLNILAFGAHPDDIELSCAGTLAKYFKQGHKVNIAIATDGSAGHPTMTAKDLIKIRKKESAEAAKIIDAELFWLGFPDQFLIDNKETRIIFIDTIRKCKPDVILTHYPGDHHQDHRMISELVFNTIVPSHLPGVKTEIEPIDILPVLYYFEGGNSFIPEEFVDITETIDIKKDMVSKHISQILAMGEIFGADFMLKVETNALYRGEQSKVKYAEAFRKADSSYMVCAKRLLP